MYSLKGKVAVVTGAGSGIGRALAQLLAAKGCTLALADINEVGLQETAASLPTPPLLQKLDVANRDAVYAFAQRVKSELGTAHIVINNEHEGIEIRKASATPPAPPVPPAAGKAGKALPTPKAEPQPTDN